MELKPLEYYIKFFSSFVNEVSVYTSRTFSIEDCKQECFLAIVECYNKAKNGIISIKDVYKKMAQAIWGKVRNYLTRNGHTLSFPHYYKYLDYLREVGNPNEIKHIPASGIGDEKSLYFLSEIEIKDFIDYSDRTGIMGLFIEGFSRKEISEKLDIEYYKVCRRINMLKRKFARKITNE